MDPRLVPLSEHDIDLAGVDIVVNTHLHFDHCGGNHSHTRASPGGRARTYPSGCDAPL